MSRVRFLLSALCVVGLTVPASAQMFLVRPRPIMTMWADRRVEPVPQYQALAAPVMPAVSATPTVIASAPAGVTTSYYVAPSSAGNPVTMPADSVVMVPQYRSYRTGLFGRRTVEYIEYVPTLMPLPAATVQPGPAPPATPGGNNNPK
ncbi:MAG: hypothetical protein ACJ8F7_17325 [Gemmataceae bacterium]